MKAELGEAVLAFAHLLCSKHTALIEYQRDFMPIPVFAVCFDNLKARCILYRIFQYARMI